MRCSHCLLSGRRDGARQENQRNKGGQSGQTHQKGKPTSLGTVKHVAVGQGVNPAQKRRVCFPHPVGPHGGTAARRGLGGPGATAGDDSPSWRRGLKPSVGTGGQHPRQLPGAAAACPGWSCRKGASWRCLQEEGCAAAPPRYH